jgi:hypothetical protein
MTQTAIEWLVEELNQKIDFIPMGKWDMIRNIVQQALEIEKEQIMDAHEQAYIKMNMSFRAADRAEDYYNETYKK